VRCAICCGGSVACGGGWPRSPPDERPPPVGGRGSSRAGGGRGVGGITPDRAAGPPSDAPCGRAPHAPATGAPTRGAAMARWGRHAGCSTFRRRRWRQLPEALLHSGALILTFSRNYANTRTNACLEPLHETVG
jgi:hypothetical protein